MSKVDKLEEELFNVYDRITLAESDEIDELMVEVRKLENEINMATMKHKINIK